MALQTQGFGLSALPQLQTVDPRLLVSAPMDIGGAINQGLRGFTLGRELAAQDERLGMERERMDILREDKALEREEREMKLPLEIQRLQDQAALSGFQLAGEKVGLRRLMKEYENIDDLASTLAEFDYEAEPDSVYAPAARLYQTTGQIELAQQALAQSALAPEPIPPVRKINVDGVEFYIDQKGSVIRPDMSIQSQLEKSAEETDMLPVTVDGETIEGHFRLPGSTQIYRKIQEGDRTQLLKVATEPREEPDPTRRAILLRIARVSDEPWTEYLLPNGEFDMEKIRRQELIFQAQEQSVRQQISGGGASFNVSQIGFGGGGGGQTVQPVSGIVDSVMGPPTAPALPPPSATPAPTNNDPQVIKSDWERAVERMRTTR